MLLWSTKFPFYDSLKTSAISGKTSFGSALSNGMVSVQLIALYYLINFYVFTVLAESKLSCDLSCLLRDLPSLPTQAFSVFPLFVTLNYSLFWRVFLVLKVFPWNISLVIYLETGGYSSGTALYDVMKSWVSVTTEVNKTVFLMTPCSLLKDIW